MILPDVNVLLYAFRPDAAGHDEYKAWLEQVVNGEASFGMSPQVLAAVIRISTHRKIYREPTPVTEALDFCANLLAAPSAVRVEPGPRHWTVFAELCASTRASGNLVQDAWYAALAIEAGAEWISTDQHFAHFAGLRWRRPF